MQSQPCKCFTRQFSTKLCPLDSYDFSACSPDLQTTPCCSLVFVMFRFESDRYSAAHADLTSTITAVDGCIKALNQAESKTEAKMMLAQHHVKMMLSLVSLKVTDVQRQSLEAFAAPKKRPGQLAKGDLGAHVDWPFSTVITGILSRVR